VKKYVVPSAVAAAFFAVCMGWTCLSSSPAAAQPPMSPGAQGQFPIAVVDVAWIIKHHTRLLAQKKELTAEVEAAGKDFDEQGRKLQEKAKQLGPGGYKPGSPEYNQAEETIVKEQSALKTAMQQKRREFVLREARMYYNAYVEISQQTKYESERRGIMLVLNFDGSPLRDENPEEIGRALSNPTRPLYYNKQSGIDITEMVMQPFVKPLPPAGPVGFTPPTTR
jgi:Skp family chaperone for outer membrane proteins